MPITTANYMPMTNCRHPKASPEVRAYNPYTLNQPRTFLKERFYPVQTKRRVLYLSLYLLETLDIPFIIFLCHTYII